jgi:hypothetical protein
MKYRTFISMIGNHKFNSIEKLKMSRAEEYSYDKFLSDSSDEYPKYEDLIKKDVEITGSQITEDSIGAVEKRIIETNIILAKEDKK